MDLKDRWTILKIAGLVLMVLLVSYSTYNYIQVEQRTIQVGYLPSNHHSALFVADELGMYYKAGLTMELVPFRSGAEMIHAMQLGQIDVGYCGIAPVTTAISKGVPIKVVAPVNTQGSGLVIPVNSTLNLSSDLSNKTVAIPRKGSVQDVLLNVLLLQNNISASQLKITELEAPLMPPSLKNGKIDAYVAWEPYVSSANFTGDGKIFLHSEEWWPNHPCCVVVARDDFIKKEPDQLSHFLKVHVKATDYILNNPDESNLIVSQKLGTSNIIETEALKHVNFISRPDDNFTADVERFMEVQKKLGELKEIPDYKTLYDFQFLGNLS
ncbi:MAG: ABC transporter substrate-binding protein [Methanobacteriaceae archaeon]|nr:ABC transporter substrate-binding protein [Methanobacteriaceae archaeon]